MKKKPRPCQNNETQQPQSVSRLVALKRTPTGVPEADINAGEQFAIETAKLITEQNMPHLFHVVRSEICRIPSCQKADTCNSVCWFVRGFDCMIGELLLCS